MRHLTSEQIQEFLDEALPPGEEALVREHLSACPHCQSESEEWSLLFSELGDLPEMSPSPAFSKEVMAGVPLSEPLAARIGSWLKARKSRALSAGHLPPERIQDYIEATLPARQAVRAGAHLAACDPCRDELKGWEKVFGSLRALGRFAPAPGFAERVMARVRVPSRIPTRWASFLPAGALAWARTALPQTHRGWAIVGGVASAPTITMAALVYLVFSNSVLTLGSLTTYVSWKASALFATLFSALADGVVESVALFRAYALVDTLTNSPALIGAGGLIFSLLSAGALWVLYKNLFVAPSDDRYERARV